MSITLSKALNLGRTPQREDADQVSQNPNNTLDRYFNLHDDLEKLRDKKHDSDIFFGIILSISPILSFRAAALKTSEKFISAMAESPGDRFFEYIVYIPEFAASLPNLDYDDFLRLSADPKLTWIGSAEGKKNLQKLLKYHRQVNRYQKFYAIAKKSANVDGRKCKVKIPDLNNPSRGYLEKIV